jgi:superoxide dismutase, Cu-Zn family
MRKILLSLACAVLGACATHPDNSVHVAMALTTAPGAAASIGEVLIAREGDGVALRLRLHGLPPGPHGFHLHTTASCEAATAANGAVAPGGAAGGHFDPSASGRHMGPMGQGHLGDLPVLVVGSDGAANQTLHVTRLHSPDEFRGHAFVIHGGGDNYNDLPAPLGGGGARLACGVIR